MSNLVHGHRIIDLRKRRAAAQTHARFTPAELPFPRRTSLRARRRKLRALAVFVVLILAGGVVYGVSELTYLPRYSIQEVAVRGTEGVSPKLVRTFVETQLNDGTYSIISRENIFLYPKAEIAKSISDYFPRILNAQISRESLLAQTITVSIVERKPFALWCSDKTSCFEMDSGGFIFAPLGVSPQEGLQARGGPLTGFAQSATSTSAGTVVYTGGLATSTAPIGQTFLKDRFAEVLTLLSRLNDQGFPATGVSVENEQDFAVSLARGFVLRASFGADASELVRNLQTVLSSDSLRGKESTIEYIDLRFGNRVYYKNKAGSQ